MEFLPKEILIREIIEKNLIWKDLNALCMVSKYFSHICSASSNDKFWEQLLKTQYDFDFWFPLTNIPMNTGSWNHLYRFFDRNKKLFSSNFVRERVDKLEKFNLWPQIGIGRNESIITKAPIFFRKPSLEIARGPRYYKKRAKGQIRFRDIKTIMDELVSTGFFINVRLYKLHKESND